ncbi:MAG: hypothetical protein MPEBLZ_02061 [Candidatus Methanoperedens nitroreducens]|uniref:Uncharacterized protein n=1 Tax=Candidatus Methanoperedens nitratireducens TaxID=1392998 RepID=A0A0P7ZF70_9EURY|nr:MAG: hypothetical protein MPEBLZ_02061 [Candidatus Methanoperedens sp. BLZ1]
MAEIAKINIDEKIEEIYTKHNVTTNTKKYPVAFLEEVENIIKTEYVRIENQIRETLFLISDMGRKSSYEEELLCKLAEIQESEKQLVLFFDQNNTNKSDGWVLGNNLKNLSEWS